MLQCVGYAVTGEAERGITPDVQIIPIDRANEAYDGMQAAEVRFRYAIDTASVK